MTDWLSQTKDVAIILAGIVAVTTFLTGVLEYVRQNAQNRAERFVLMRRRFMENEVFRDICTLLMTDDPRLRDIPLQDKRNFGGFLEEIALTVNSRLIRREVAHYMFGYYVLLCWDSKNFWHGIDRQSRYWSMFHEFAAQMRALEATSPEAYRRLGF